MYFLSHDHTAVIILFDHTQVASCKLSYETQNMFKVMMGLLQKLSETSGGEESE